MAKFIKDVHDLVHFLAGKNVATKQSPERIDAVVYEVVIDLFNTYYKNYVKTQEIDDFMLPFKRASFINVDNNIGLLPPDYQHARALRTVTGNKIDLVFDKFWDGRKNSKMAPPSATNPIARIEMIQVTVDLPLIKRIEVYPGQNVVLEYFKAPAKTQYAYSINGTKYIYDDAASVDVEFSPLLFPEIKKRVLSSLGINLRDNALTGYAEQTKQTEQPK